MTERMEGKGGSPKVRRPIRVMIGDEDLEDVKAHGFRYNGPGQTEEDVEGQGARGTW